MNYASLLKMIESYKQKYSVKVIGKSEFKRNIFAVERVVDATLPTAIFVASTHAREHITTDLVCKMLDENLFDKICQFNLSFVLMANPDGVELSYNGINSAPFCQRKKLIKINGGSKDFSLWKANGKGVDINNNFDANFGCNRHSEKPASSGYIGKFPECAAETKALSNFVKKSNTFFVVTYHSKGEEIYFNFFQEGKILERDTLIAKQFENSTGYVIKNVENESSGGLKDFCVQKLGIPAITIEIGNDSLTHPIGKEFLSEIFERHKNVANDLIFAYNVFRKYE